MDGGRGEEEGVVNIWPACCLTGYRAHLESVIEPVEGVSRRVCVCVLVSVYSGSSGLGTTVNSS